VLNLRDAADLCCDSIQSVPLADRKPGKNLNPPASLQTGVYSGG
jgi:hypothetical protein